ncbi:MAG: hypothetical protein CVV35_08670 [Methanomicrobiales archaeon HGW-Methanomicrobiales-6]|nr:MAG: hypothetical protein CVV35_08670 [Methanomicrobiales archaeon HGW-Methanomicrobiales-6]
MLIGESSGNPDDGLSLKSSTIRDYLAKVRVICLLKLVFDEHICIGSKISCKNVSFVRTHPLLSIDGLQFHAKSITQDLKVFGLGKPGCKIPRFI